MHQAISHAAAPAIRLVAGGLLAYAAVAGGIDALAATLAVTPRCAESDASGAPGTPLPPLGAATRLLVIAPHPDDETLCCAGIMQRVLHAGGRVSIVWLTSGDGSILSLLAVEHAMFGWHDKARELAQRRMSEARQATASLGVARDGQLFLGYPDGALARLRNENLTTPYRSPLTGATTVPYPEAVFPGHPYTGESLEHDLETVIAGVGPTLILAPSPLDRHPDHRIAGLIARSASTARAPAASVYVWLVHGGEGWPSPRGLLAGVPLTTAPVVRGLAVTAFSLAPDEEDRKLAALALYRSQMQTLAPFLLAFVRTSESFMALDARPVD